MSEQVALIIQFTLFGLCGLGATIAGLVYVKTKGAHGGIIFLFLLVVTWSIGSGIYDNTQEVLP